MSSHIITSDSIVLTPINDGITISMSPSSCSISADFNGRNQNLDRAFTDISLFLGPKQLEFALSIIEISDSRITYMVTEFNGGLTKRFRLTSVPPDILTGYVKFGLRTIYNELTTGIFQFAIVRDINTLDWIVDWDNNKTKIGGDYLITPQLFVGKKITSPSQVSVLTGVYIGPEGIAPNSSAGIYGYKEGVEIFHINETGGSIGGWDINNGGIQTSDGKLTILSEGSIIAKDAQGNVIWGLYSSGEAIFARGNVTFGSDGSAVFKGEITSSKGEIGGWKITDDKIYSAHIMLNSSENYIGISPYDIPNYNFINDSFTHFSRVRAKGGIAIHYSSGNSYGIEGYLPNSINTFKLGSTNFIAGWSFDNESLYIGTKNNTLKQYTDASGSLTLGTKGMRGYGWYIDSSGEVSFMKGLISFNSTSGMLLGWQMYPNRLSNAYVALVSTQTDSGFYLSADDISDVSLSGLEGAIRNTSGILIKRKTGGVELTGINDAKVVFSLLSSGDSIIAGWKFNQDAIYSGTFASSGFTNSSGGITISKAGIRGYKWRFEPDGSGALAGENITWNPDGSGTLAKGNITWDAGGLFTFGNTLSNNTSINNGLVLSKNIFVCNSEGVIKAGMSADGSGNAGIRFFAGETNPVLAPFRVDENGRLYATNANIVGTINATSGYIGGTINDAGEYIGGFEIADGRIGSSAEQSGDGGFLAIYNNFIRVGGNNGYVMFGDDVIPASVGGAFTAAGRIVNNKVNNDNSFGYDTANYGLFIDVTGGTKNYGISSNAPLKAPAFINTRVKELNFTGSSYSIDFSLASIFLLYANQAYNITMPTEAAVARMFSYSSLPNDFGTTVTFKVRANSARITLLDVYDYNENATNFAIESGDAVIILISKMDGFKYRMLTNYR
jgi:hypothetical protein